MTNQGSYNLDDQTINRISMEVDANVECSQVKTCNGGNGLTISYSLWTARTSALNVTYKDKARTRPVILLFLFFLVVLFLNNFPLHTMLFASFTFLLPSRKLHFRYQPGNNCLNSLVCMWTNSLFISVNLGLTWWVHIYILENCVVSKFTHVPYVSFNWF